MASRGHHGPPLNNLSWHSRRIEGNADTGRGRGRGRAITEQLKITRSLPPETFVAGCASCVFSESGNSRDGRTFRGRPRTTSCSHGLDPRLARLTSGQRSTQIVARARGVTVGANVRDVRRHTYRRRVRLSPNGVKIL